MPGKMPVYLCNVVDAVRLPFFNKPQAEVVMYTTLFCGYCVRARRLLDQKKVKYREIGVDNNRELWQEMEQRSARRTVPQIFIDGHPVGGFTELNALEQSGELDRLLYPQNAGVSHEEN